MNDMQSRNYATAQSRSGLTGRRDVNTDGENDLSLARLADEARHLPSTAWKVGGALVAVALVAALIAFALALRNFVG